MSNVRISRKHNLDSEECRALSEELLSKLVSKFGGSYRERGDCYSYRHSTGLKAIVEPAEGRLNIDVKLTMMTRSFAPMVEKQINEVLDDHIGVA
jgi:putative polyhydroxyalkanoate system protein